MVAPTKVCANPDCDHAGERQPWTNFYPRSRWEDGTVRTVQSYCRRCSTGGVRKWRADNHRRAREQDRKAYETIKGDPERLAVLRMQKRDRAYYARGILSGRRVSRQMREAAATSPLLPAEPFSAWLNTLDPETVRNLPASPEVLRRLRNRRQSQVSIDTVDRCCLAMDVHIDTLYPLEDAT